MKKLFLALMLFPVLSFAQLSPTNESLPTPSLLNATAEVEGFGQIRYRAPIHSSDEFPILLVHGIYGGASHRAFKNILPLLDAAQQKVYIIDLPGIGESDQPKRPYSLEDLDLFLERFIATVIKDRTTVVTESLMSASGLRVAALRPDLVRRLILLSPTGVNSLAEPPSQREQQLYDRLYNDEAASSQFYQNLLIDNSLNYFLKFAFYNDSLVNDDLLNDYRTMRFYNGQKYLSISFVGGQLYRPFVKSAEGVFVPTLLIFGAEYENFADTKPTKAEEFKKLRPDFEYLEIPLCGSSVQREKPEATAQAILNFTVRD